MRNSGWQMGPGRGRGGSTERRFPGAGASGCWATGTSATGRRLTGCWVRASRRIPARWVPVALVVLVPLLAGCAGGPGRDEPAVPAEQVEAARDRLLAPYRKGREVLCDDLVLELTANFLQDVTQPSHDPELHSFEQDDRDGYTEYRWRNPGGVEGMPFTFYLQNTKVLVVYSARLRVLTGRQPMTLSATASGNTAVFDPEEDRMVEGLDAVVVQDGQWTQRGGAADGTASGAGGR